MRRRFLAQITAEGGWCARDVFADESPAAPLKMGSAPEGAFVEVEVVDGVARPLGAPLAERGSAKAELVRIAIAHGLDPVFPEDVRREVEALLSTSTAAGSAAPGTDDPALVDLSEVPFVTIDNADSRDLDQALYIAPDGEGHLVRYALADAAHYVRPGSALFREALARGASFYLPGWMVPMLPRALSEGVVSLNANVLRRAVVFDMRLDAEGRCTSTTIVRARIRSHAKLTYDGVQELLDAPEGEHPYDQEPYGPSLRALREVGERRIDDASARDVVHHRRRTVEAGLDGTQSFVLYGGLRNDVERYNEQVSLLCNVEGARRLVGGEGAPDMQAIYRVHPAPPGRRVEELASQIEAIAALHGLGDAPRWRWRRDEGQSLARFLDQLPRAGSGVRLARAIQRQAILTNVRSSFSDEAAGHHGVGADVYARFSSPMREIVGIFLHKELLEQLGAEVPVPPERDAELRAAVIEAANRSKGVQSRLTRLGNRLAIDAMFARDASLPRDERPVRRATVMGITQGKVYLSLDEPPIDVKLYRQDLADSAGALPRVGSGELTLERDSDDVRHGGEVIVTVGGAVSVVVSHHDPRRDRWVLAPATGAAPPDRRPSDPPSR